MPRWQFAVFVAGLAAVYVWIAIATDDRDLREFDRPDTEDGRAYCGSLCSIHEAGAAWARDQEIADEVECIPLDRLRGKRRSEFELGCREYVLKHGK